MNIPTWLIVAAIIVTIVVGTALTLIRGVLVDRTRARNKQLIMDHYGGLTGWPTSDDTASKGGRRSKEGSSKGASND